MLGYRAYVGTEGILGLRHRLRNIFHPTHPDSGITDEQQTKVAWFEVGATLDGSQIKKHLDDDLRKQIETLLAKRVVVESTAAISIAIAAGRWLFDLFMDRRLKGLEERKAAASQSYSATAFFDKGSELRTKIAILLIRHKKGEEAPTFAALLQIRQRGGKGDRAGGDGDQPKAFTFEPIYVRAVKAVAITSENAAAISVSLALAIKSLNQGKDGPVELVAAGQGAVTVAKLEIGKNKQPFVCQGDCPVSDLIPYPPADEPCSVSLAITETGDLGFDVDARIAETKALKEALGPAITQALTEALNEKEEA